MCGFAGFTGYLADGDAVLERMMNKIIHRGPDSAGKYIDDKAYMGFVCSKLKCHVHSRNLSGCLEYKSVSFAA